MRARGPLTFSLLAGMLLLPAVGVCTGPKLSSSAIEPPVAKVHSDEVGPRIAQPGQKHRAPLGGSSGDAVHPPMGLPHAAGGLRSNLESGLIVSGDGKIVSTRPGGDGEAVAGGVSEAKPAAQSSHAKPAAAGSGLGVRPLSSAERHTLGVADGGLLVTSVDDAAARRAGLKEGDVVLMLDGVRVSDPQQFQSLLHQLPHDRPVPVLVRRPGTTLFLPLGAPAR